ncbi:toll/interleukin-1 receptor domain-containing protein [Caballeronia sp. LZ008]|nr:toll/interleukin-1 receptor domain-containing protein [Caballeronia sp. INML5]MDR5796481.1 toll/interleukin-1 receptor domain-containing protein [Caballeronia sp. LZ008]
MADFFISYTYADTDWAQWIGYVLEEEGFSVGIQAWDFRPGSNSVLEMQKAAASAKRTVMVLSPDYLQSQFASPEWAAAFGQDPQGQEMKLVPVMVRKCDPPGLFKSIVQI